MQPTRRQALTAGAAALVATACTADPAPRPAPRTPDDALREAAVAREQGLVDAYGAALRALPQHTALLAPLLGDHAAHLAALRPGPSSSPATSFSPSPSPSRLPGASLARLAALEWIRAAWITKANGRRARVYELTAAGRKQLGAEEARWQAVTSAVNRILRMA